MSMKKFPLVQMLTVVAIIAVLAAMALPESVKGAQDSPPAATQVSQIPEKSAAASSEQAAASWWWDDDDDDDDDNDDIDDSWGPVDPPDRPDGPSKGKVNKKLTFKTEGSNMAGTHQYVYDWGDGSKMKWDDDEKQSHKYKKPGTYTIRVKESCPWKTFQTKWSKSKKVKISK